jgi:hypothetical protein
MPRVGFEPTNPVFERAKAVHALDRAATLLGKFTDILKERRTKIYIAVSAQTR